MVKSFIKEAGRQLFVAVTSFASVVFLFSYFGNYDPPVSFIHAQAQTEPVQQGGILTIYWEVERTRRCYVMFDRELYTDVDGENRRIPLANDIREGGLPVTQREKFTTTVKIPLDAPPGPAMFRSTGLYSCNLFQYKRPIVVPAPEVRFTISQRVASSGADTSR